MIISAFPGTGKSYYSQRHPEVLDSDSSLFSWVHTPEGKVRNPQFPSNYLEHIRIAHNAGHTVFVSSHQEIRDAMTQAGFPFLVVYPNKSLKGEYMKRFEERGSPQGFLTLLDRNWDAWIDGLSQLENKLEFTRIDQTISTEEYEWQMSYHFHQKEANFGVSI